MEKPDDKAILENISALYTALECGGDGNCLFYSIQHQIGQSQTLQKTLPETISAQWKNERQEDSFLLRKMAIDHERDFIKRIKAEKGPLTDSDQFLMTELYKDICEELHSKGLHEKGTKHADLKALLLKAAKEGKKEDINSFVLTNFDKYAEFTATKNNWAGSSELLAIGNVLNVTVKSYGNDLEPAVKKDGVYQPYLVNPVPGDLEIVVFQCYGGGHYKALIKK